MKVRTTSTDVELQQKYNDSDDDSDSDNDGPPALSAQAGLSAETLRTLMEFQEFGCFQGESEEEAASHATKSIAKDTVCVAYTAKDSQVIAETMRRLQAKANESDNDSGFQQDMQERLKGNVLTKPPAGSDLLEEFHRDGVVRINNVLNDDLCDQCLSAIHRGLLDDGSKKEGFGNVFSRSCRYDMYLRPRGVYKEALQELLDTATPLGDLLHRCAENQPCVFHEFSSLTADPGAANQPIHPDAPFSDVAPLWTVFVALQDVTLEMGPTVFVPRSHVDEALHTSLKASSSSSRWQEQLQQKEFLSSVLQKGDAAIMDARTLHFGSANSSTDARRTLMYFTLRNPLYAGVFPTDGSLFTDLANMTTEDFAKYE